MRIPKAARIWVPFSLVALCVIAGYVCLVLQARQAGLDHALIMAIRRRDTRSAIRLLSEGASANSQDRPWAPMTFRTLLADMLVRLRGRTQPKMAQPCTSAIALWYEPQGDTFGSVPTIPENLPLMQALIEQGADANGTNWQGVSVLDSAAISDHLQTVQILLEHHANPNHSCSVHYAPLWYAYPRIAKVLIAHGADVNLRDESGGTALHNIPFTRNFDTAEVLIAHGADVNAADSSGSTPLMNAVFCCDLELAKLLYAHGARLDARDKAGRTVLIWATMRLMDYDDEALDEVRWLLEHGARANVKDRTGQTALDYAGSDLTNNKRLRRLLQRKVHEEQPARPLHFGTRTPTFRRYSHRVGNPT